MGRRTNCRALRYSAEQLDVGYPVLSIKIRTVSTGDWQFMSTAPPTKVTGVWMVCTLSVSTREHAAQPKTEVTARLDGMRAGVILRHGTLRVRCSIAHAHEQRRRFCADAATGVARILHRHRDDGRPRAGGRRHDRGRHPVFPHRLLPLRPREVLPVCPFGRLAISPARLLRSVPLAAIVLRSADGLTIGRTDPQRSAAQHSAAQRSTAQRSSGAATVCNRRARALQEVLQAAAAHRARARVLRAEERVGRGGGV